MTLSPALDLFPLTAALLAALTCGLLGNFLVLQRQSMMGDAISHAVLPGLVIAFLVTSSRNPIWMLLGAGIAGAVCVVLVEAVKALGKVEPGAAMGVVFSVMFALGVLLIEQASARVVHLDAHAVLYGQLETLVWYGAPASFGEALSWSTVEAIPRPIWLLMIVAVLSVGFVALLFKELRLAAFDPQLATSQGYHAKTLHYALMLLVAAATVAAFEAVGSILVIAMLIAPAATARLMTDRLVSQVGVSLLTATVAGVGGYVGATLVPSIFDAGSVNAAGSMAVVAGALVTLAAFGSPRHGVIARKLRQRTMQRSAAVDDLLATLYRRHESGQLAVSLDALPSRITSDIPYTAAKAQRKGWLQQHADELRMTDAGLNRAATLMRRHRLWEDYLVNQAGLEPDHVHETAERLEHLSVTPNSDIATDPHGKPVPPPQP